MFERILNNDDKMFEIEKTLCTAESDSVGQWRIPSIMLDMQEMAERHCQTIGCDFMSLRKDNCAWVLIKMEFRFTKAPKCFQGVRFRTEPHKNRHQLHERYYYAYDARTGEKLFTVNTVWAIVDLDGRKAINYDVKYLPEHELTQAPFKLNRISLREVKFEKTEEKTPLLSDCDINSHVNNVKYIEWVLNALPMEKVLKRYIKRISFIYKSEIPMGQKVRMYIHDSEEASGGVIITDKNANDACDTSANTEFAVKMVTADDEEKLFFECVGEYGQAKASE